MNSYKLSNLTTNTPKNDQTKLMSNLQGLSGVDAVKLHPEKGEFSLTCQESKQPKHDVVETACTKAGFTLTTPAAAGAKNPATKK